MVRVVGGGSLVVSIVAPHNEGSHMATPKSAITAKGTPKASVTIFMMIWILTICRTSEFESCNFFCDAEPVTEQLLDIDNRDGCPTPWADSPSKNLIPA